ncbi:flagellar hook protein FlgE [Neokomagataea thailandica NBRC 106555]|uniref:Flagellar hook protein FlgE n=2 Tax=Neokomagataea TaxID=1223423 RepID=A0A4Y6V5M7_9PROT|nr:MULTISPECIES: flagellar hook protein FlgE [Neokomagataea]QDH24664.1 flagellar hook protein FlgE [Neokomagataea tanensis]GBR53900.1 flagellar hook protein FlgE [Neokomagataea thailandica NBRC 106555]
MSLFNALNTAVSGLNAQSHAFSDLSNNIANSQTVGYKSTGTSFSDYVTAQTKASLQGSSDSVAAVTTQNTEYQGSVTTSSNPLGMAISGRGFFSVLAPSGGTTAQGTTSFNTQNFYTRNGDFSQNSDGYLVNTSGYYLQGYQVQNGGSLSTNISPIQVSSNLSFQPTKSTSLTVSGVVGSTATTGVMTSTTATAYDSQGAAHNVTLNWQQSASDPLTWTVSNGNDYSNQTSVVFNTDGSLKSVGGTVGTNGTSAVFNYAGAPQNLSVKLGTIGGTSGVSLGTSSSASSSLVTTSDSVTSGNYTGLSVQKDGSIMASFDNGLSQLVAKVPLATFADPDSLSVQNGQAYTATSGSGGASLNAVGTNGAGSLATSSLESSTTDLTGDLTKLVVAQQAYGANTKVVSTSNQMLQTTLAMIQ